MSYPARENLVLRHQIRVVLALAWYALRTALMTTLFLLPISLIARSDGWYWAGLAWGFLYLALNAEPVAIAVLGLADAVRLIGGREAVFGARLTSVQMPNMKVQRAPGWRRVWWTATRSVNPVLPIAIALMIVASRRNKGGFRRMLRAIERQRAAPAARRAFDTPTPAPVVNQVYEWERQIGARQPLVGSGAGMGLGAGV